MIWRWASLTIEAHWRGKAVMTSLKIWRPHWCLSSIITRLIYCTWHVIEGKKGNMPPQMKSVCLSKETRFPETWTLCIICSFTSLVWATEYPSCRIHCCIIQEDWEMPCVWSPFSNIYGSLVEGSGNGWVKVSKVYLAMRFHPHPHRFQPQEHDRTGNTQTLLIWGIML